MPRPSILLRVRRSIAKQGLRQFTYNIFNTLYSRLVPFEVPTHPFDLRYGVDTGGFINPRNFTTGHVNESHSIAYYGTAPSLFTAIIEQWRQVIPASPRAPEDFGLIDIGCGKGRVVMLASDYSFLKIIGVDLQPDLVAIAQQNLVKWLANPHACTNISALVADALELPIPDTPTLFYLFNSFDEYMVELFLDRLQALCLTRTAPIDIVYTHPIHADVIARRADFSLIWSGRIRFSREDAAADAFRARSETCRMYRLHPRGVTP